MAMVVENARKEQVLTVKSPAKLNTYLKIIGKRDDGYHEIISVMIPIDIYDILHFTLINKGIELICRGRHVESGITNLAYKAALQFYNKTKISSGVKIELIKRIPLGAGLGGGSSNAACVLMTLNFIHGEPLTFDELLELGRNLGADVPFFLFQEPCLARGIGDILTPIEKWPSFWYVIIVPPIQVSTKWAYDNLKLELTENKHNYIISWLKQTDYDALENDLETVTLSKFPKIAELKSLLEQLGAKGALMSGSGSSVFGLFTTKGQALEAKNILEKKGIGEIFITTLWRKNKAGFNQYREVFP